MGILVYQGVSKSFGEKRALNDVSLEVEEGEVFGLLGPNGAGKTTLIRIAFDILRPDEGEVKLFGQNLSRGLLDRASYLPEERGIYAGSKVLEVLEYFARLKGMKKRAANIAAKRWLQRVGLSSVGNQRVQSLSKGMTQKIQIAGALITDPEFCVLDEPFSGLDPLNIALIKELIHERKKAGKTTVLSTHMMNQVEALCDRVALIHRGQKVVYGNLTEIRAKHSHPEALVELGGPLPEIPYIRRSEDQGRGVWILEVDTHADLQRLLRDLVSRTSVIRFSPIVATMDDIFISAVGDKAS